MTWTLRASGETPAAGGEPEWHKLETELVDELRKVLANPKFAAVSSFFRGKHLASDVHTAVADVETQASDVSDAARAAPDAEPAPEAPRAAVAKPASSRAAKTPKGAPDVAP